MPLARCSPKHSGAQRKACKTEHWFPPDPGRGHQSGACWVVVGRVVMGAGHSRPGRGGGDLGKGSPPWALGTHRKPSPSVSRAGAAHSPWPLKGRRTRPGWSDPVRTRGRGRRPDSREARPASPKRRRRHPGPEARDPLAAVTTRLWQRMGALEVALDELRAPGGAFLPVPTRRTQPSASQRAWLSWQLAHSGATLHWAAARLHALLAAQPGP